MLFENSGLLDKPVIRKAFNMLHAVACANDPRIADAFNAKAAIEHGVNFALFVDKHRWSLKPQVIAGALVKDLKLPQVKHYTNSDLPAFLEKTDVASVLKQAAHVFKLEEMNKFFLSISNRAHLKEAFEGKSNAWRVQKDADAHAAALAGAEDVLRYNAQFVEDKRFVLSLTQGAVDQAKKIRTPEFCKDI